MLLNVIWAGFILVAIFTTLLQVVLFGATDLPAQMVKSLFDTSKTAFEIALGLTGVMTLWLGIMKVGERAGLIDLMARGLAPLFRRLFPGVPAGHPALGSMTMNIAANMLGLDNAATPLGLKAMRELQTLNPEPDTATDAQILFLVINTAAVTLFPVTIMAYRAQMGAADPSDVFIPLILASYIATVSGVALVAAMQRGGGIITAQDLMQYKPLWRTPIKSTYRGYTMFSISGVSCCSVSSPTAPSTAPRR